MAWDPKTYLKFEAERTRPAAELLSRVPGERPARVVDLGCGPGNSTALLAARWPGADLEGFDSSAEMLEKAKASGVPARWTLGDIATWSPDGRFDVVYSNATLQWIADHERLLPRLMSFVADGGTFAFQVPRNFKEPGHTILDDLANAPRWREAMANARGPGGVHEPGEYFAILEAHAARIDIWETTYLQVLDGEDAVYHWMSGTGARPFIQAVEGAEREAFVAEYKKRLAIAYPRRASGKTLYPFQRLFLVASR